tara:strand:- start:4 stop:438 length:435 start_codon:yes stop_codon:yes gene_type:complete
MTKNNCESSTTSDFKVFVYGTLKPGGHYWPAFCAGKLAAEPVPAKIRGELYDLHVGYPGLLLRGEQWVHGYLLEMADAAAFAGLDYLEGYVPGRPAAENDYNRLRMTCYTPAGEALAEVWIYEMSVEKIAQHDGTRIESGDWPV